MDARTLANPRDRGKSVGLFFVLIPVKVPSWRHSFRCKNAAVRVYDGSFY